MSDKEKNPDFHLEIDEDDLELTLDDNIFEEKEANENDDLLTEEELENLIIGIDEENDILDIPDEEEVLEELKFFDENFSLLEKKEEEKKEKISKEEEKAPKVKKEKVKKEKKPKAPREPIDIQYFIIKNKFKLVGAFIAFIVAIFIITFFLVLNKKPKVEEFETVTTSESAIVLEESPKEELSEEDIAINSLKEELALVKDEARKLALQNEIIKLEEKKVTKLREERIGKLQKELTQGLTSLSPSLVKSEEDILIMALTVENENYTDDLYKTVAKIFEDEYQINKLSLTILSKGEKIQKLGQVTVDINKFKEVSIMDITIQEKLKLMNFEKRMK